LEIGDMMITRTLRAESEHAYLAIYSWRRKVPGRAAGLQKQQRIFRYLNTGANLEIRWRLYLLWHFSDCFAFFTKFITEQILRADGNRIGNKGLETAAATLGLKLLIGISQ
jgi:hypothetical protein